MKTQTVTRRSVLLPSVNLRALAGLVGLGCALAAATAPAATKVTVASRATSPGPVQSAQSSANVPVDLTSATNCVVSTPYGTLTTSGSAWARAEVGQLHLDSEGLANATYTGPATGDFIAGYGWADAEASWSDYFTLSAPGLVGQVGSATVTLSIGGNLSLSGYPSSQATFQVTAQVGSTVLEGGTRLYVDNNGHLQTQPMSGGLIGPGIWPLPFQFHFGSPVNVLLAATCVANADAESYFNGGTPHAAASSDFGHTIVWTGITNVQDANGNPVIGATLTSTSGYDYLLGSVTNAPIITRIQPTVQGLTLEWTDLGPRPYTVETTGSLTGETWTPANGVTWPITTHSVVLPLPQGRAFFRVKVR